MESLVPLSHMLLKLMNRGLPSSVYCFISSFSHYLSVQSQYFLTVHRMLILCTHRVFALEVGLSLCRGSFHLLLGPQLIHHLLGNTLLNVLCRSFTLTSASRSQKPISFQETGVSVSNMRAGSCSLLESPH